MTGYIELKEMRFYARHGVMEQERAVGNEFEVNMRLSCEITADAWEGDDLSGTVNYADVYSLVEKEMGKPSNLLENVAFRIGQAVKRAYPGRVAGGTVEVAKYAPPFTSRIKKVAVTLVF